MQTEEPCTQNEELIDTLIAISVVAKHLAEQLRKETEDEQNGKNE